MSSPDNMVNFGPLTAEIGWGVWGTPANFNWSRVLAALLRGTLVVGVSQTLRRWPEGATSIWQGGHHVGHWPTFLVLSLLTIALFLVLAPKTRTMLDTLGKWKRVVRACAKTWITTAWYNWGKNERRGRKRMHLLSDLMTKNRSYTAVKREAQDRAKMES